MDYTKYRELSTRLITKYGTSGTVVRRELIRDPVQAWKSSEQITSVPVKLLQFDDDGILFVNHNITGHVRILIIAPTTLLTAIEIGDSITYGVNSVTVQKIQKLDPNNSGAILWAVLVQ